ncbi:hypothetical protein [Lactococcus fujiensis]|uniref:Uncharacterized protein n=1 Tax=Lactococcus fujiensis JCM 16395 TaxID=1291764 RepID=A0A2A5RI49_9LACT|nr:hypothetical protein [Lactococcus fujiensis]PCR98805.1 hypothetical protein RT41_GL000884 [Lactococcus fujiensis JCM 16395]
MTIFHRYDKIVNGTFYFGLSGELVKVAKLLVRTWIKRPYTDNPI